MADSEREAAWAARWAAGAWRGERVTTAGGESYQILYEGRRGGPAGPDFRDAILVRADGSHIVGDVELHLRAGGWRAHGHERDARYSSVVLHIVFHPLPSGAPSATRLPAGGSAPIVVLSREAPAAAPPALPCLNVARRVPADLLRTALLDAGTARLAAHADFLLREIAHAGAADEEEGAPSLWAPEDRVLWVHLAEALGYGRDRATLCEAGARLLAAADFEAVARDFASLSRLDSARFASLVRLRASWAATGPWEPLLRALRTGPARAASEAVCRVLCRAAEGGISPTRARILTVNVVLPFAIARASLDGDRALHSRAEAVYDAAMGLQSNTLTRLLSRQFGMARLPAGAHAQQGLHHIWSEWCREKLCAECPIGLVAKGCGQYGRCSSE